MRHSTKIPSSVEYAPDDGGLEPLWRANRLWMAPALSALSALLSRYTPFLRNRFSTYVSKGIAHDLHHINHA